MFLSIPTKYRYNDVIVNLSFPFYAVVDDKLHEFVDAKYEMSVAFDAEGKCYASTQSFIGYKKDDEEGIKLDPFALFKTEEDFKRGKAVKVYKNTFGRELGYKVDVVAKTISADGDDEEREEIVGYVYDKVKMLPVPFSAYSIDIIHNTKNGGGKKNQILINGFDHKEYDIYRTEEDILSNNPYRKVDMNGQETIVSPEYYKIRPTDEQKVILMQIDSLIKQAKECGVKFIYDKCDDTLMAFNNNGIREFGYDVSVDEDSREDAENAGLLIYRENIGDKHCFVLPSFSYFDSDDEAIYIKSDEYIRKEAEKAKADK